MWLRDPEKLLIANPLSRVLLRECVRATYTEKGRVESNPRAGSLIYSQHFCRYTRVFYPELALCRLSSWPPTIQRLSPSPAPCGG